LTGQYSLILRWIHWTTTLLVLIQVSLAISNIVLYEPRPILAEWLVQTHISIGSVILLLTVLRIIARAQSPCPPRSKKKGLRVAAGVVHGLLYLCLLALPLTGYLKLAALEFTVTLFNAITLPTLPLNISLASSANAAHDAIAIVLGGLILIHIGAALLHPRFDGQSVLWHIAITRNKARPKMR